MRASRSFRSEKGASAIVVALSMILMLGFAALAVDVGAGFNERRQDQNTADSATMGGAIELLVSTAADPLQEATDQAKALVDANLNLSLPQSDWDSCQDPDALEWLSSDPALNIAGGSDCISFGADSSGTAFSKIRVRVPSQQIATSFGGVVGIDFLTTSAFAEATLTGGGASGAFPSGVYSGTPGGAEVCIKTGTGAANKESCGDPSTGDFGNFQPYFYYEINPASNPKSECTSGNQSDPLSRAMADGLDHPLGVITGSAPRINGDNCPQVPGPVLPNRVDSKAGYSNTDITNGLIKGNNWDGPFTGRLTRSNTSGYGTATVFNNNLDNRPLWTYILEDTDPILVQAGRTLDASCRAARDSINWASQYDTIMGNLKTCIGVENGQIFNDAIGATSRLASVPKYAQSVPLPSNSCCYDIIDFVPIFIQGVWTSMGPQWTCSGEMVSVPGEFCKHEPGLTGSISIAAAGQQKIDSASAIVLKCGQLPEDICKRLITGAGDVNAFSKLELTK